MTMYRIPVRARVGAAIFIGTVAFRSALAQTADSAPAPDPKAEHQTEPVTVTSTAPLEYRANDANVGALGNLPLIRAPFSVNVITQDLLVNQQASFLGDWLKNDPSANVGNVVISFATLRGFLL